jgi:uncharacterized membrane protein
MELNEIRQILELQKTILDEIDNLKHGNPDAPLTLGEKLADKMVDFMGSWKFVIAQAFFLLIWLTWNIKLAAYGLSWDLYPFILLNLVLTFQAAFAAPIILLAQNRAANKDRSEAHKAYRSLERVEKLLDILNAKVKNVKNGNNNGNKKETEKK